MPQAKPISDNPIKVLADPELKKDLLAFRSELARVCGRKWSVSNIVINLIRHSLPVHSKAVLMKEPKFWETWKRSHCVATLGPDKNRSKKGKVKFLRKKLTKKGRWGADYWRSRVV